MTDPTTTESAAPTPYDWVRDQTRVHVTWATGTGTQAEGVVVAYYVHPTLVIRRDDGWKVHVALAPGAKVTELPAAPAGPECCDMHNEHCEPPSELCCGRCTEWDHPRHPAGVRCTWLPAPSSAAAVETAVTAQLIAEEARAEIAAIIGMADDGTDMMDEIMAVVAALVRAAEQRGAEKEQERIVAYLREFKTHIDVQRIADAIEGKQRVVGS
jgi:hypothetical protein